MSRSSEVIETLTTAFVDNLIVPGAAGAESRLQARWFVRVIVSLLSLPEQSEAEERAIVERFAVPPLLDGRADG